MTDTSALPLIGFFASARKHDARSFCESHPDPVLLFEATVATGSDEQFVTTATTAVAEMRRTHGTEAGKIGLENRVAVVRKSARNPIANQISIGRGPENDVVINEPTVSKEHAFIEKHDGKWLIADLESANGTFVGGTQLQIESVAISDRSRVALGTCAMTFLEPASFYAYLREVLEKTGPVPA